ncbi:hypothetical protein Sjap_020022 [Stephania japonica]|uniref:C2H2-type domain-containing protein n=1 Tax=Stephania japonica TaxID=461633 RepID=A0AAP0F578_9MAGN
MASDMSSDFLSTSDVKLNGFKSIKNVQRHYYKQYGHLRKECRKLQSHGGSVSVATALSAQVPVPVPDPSSQKYFKALMQQFAQSYIASSMSGQAVVSSNVPHSIGYASLAPLRMPNQEISQWPPTTKIMIDSKTHTIMVEACDFCGESFHPTYACPYHPRYGNHHSSSYASPQPDFCMSRPSPRSPQLERRTIEDMEKDMISDWLSPSTKKYPFDGWSNSSYQQDTYSSMQNQPSRDIIRFLLETEQDMDLTEQELDQWIEQRDQEK